MRLVDNLGPHQAVRGPLPETSGAWEGSRGTCTTSRRMRLMQVQTENKKLGSLCDFKTILRK